MTIFRTIRPVFLLKPKLLAKVTSRYLDHLPLDGIMAEGQIAYALAHNCRKRVVVLPETTDFQDAAMEITIAVQEFNLNYFVYNEKAPYTVGLDLLKTTPLIKTIKEDGDTYYVHAIKKIH